MKNYKLLTRLLVLIFLFTASPVIAGTGSIQGKVIDNESQGISGVFVELHLNDSYFKHTQTNNEGEYSFNNLDVGSYKIGFFSYNINYIDQWYEGKTNRDDASPIPIESTDDSLTLLDTILQRGGSISGQVTDDGTRTGIEGVEVAIHLDGVWIKSSQKTGTDGIYTVTGLDTGKYTVLFGAYNTPYVSTWYNGKEEDFADIVPVTAPNDTPGINAVLSIGGTISGTVRNQYGLVKDAWIDVYDNDTNWKGYAISATDGAYTVKGLPDIELKVQFFERTYQNKGAGKQLWYNQTKNVAEATSVAVNSTGIDALFEPSKASKLLPAYQQLLLTP